MAKLIKSTIRLFAALFVTLTAICVGCSDDPGVENYYTAKGEMASTYLTNRSETYSEFIEIIKRSNTVSFELLGTYGSFTVFAPTNEAIDRYLAGRGFSSVDELTTEDCDTIAATHRTIIFHHRLFECHAASAEHVGPLPHHHMRFRLCVDAGCYQHRLLYQQ